ncbi:hypothetical protein PYW07_017167 [Mythimna separata]|uniref:Uncharacterized protein n=1 Tax=Mythimna separata TaxID=271217 RepID=A0AAD8DY88_MYTSE|nr:hypothetical protein PYW07_017167 [Mythimna separata]
MINILSYVGMNMQSEVCLWCLLGLVRTIFDATLFKVNANLKQVWQMSMPEELSKPVQRALRTMVSGIMLVQCFTVYIYLAAYIVLLYPVFLEERPALVLPWLLLAAVRKLLCELTSLAVGLGTCLLLGPARQPCVKFVIVKFASIIPAFYMWMLVFSYYHTLKVAAAFKTFPANMSHPDNDYGLELAVRRRRTKSLFGEDQLRKKLVASFYGERTSSATDETYLRPAIKITPEIVISTDASLEDEGPEVDVMKPPVSGWSDIGTSYIYEDWFGSEITIPRDADRILEQFVLMLLRIGAYMKRGDIEAVDSQMFTSAMSWHPRDTLDCSTINADATETPPHIGSSKGNIASYLRDYPQIFNKKQSNISQTDLTFATLKTVHSLIETDENTSNKNKGNQNSPSSRSHEEMPSVGVEKVSSKKRITISDSITSPDDKTVKLKLSSAKPKTDLKLKPKLKRQHGTEGDHESGTTEIANKELDDLQQNRTPGTDLKSKKTNSTETFNSLNGRKKTHVAILDADTSKINSENKTTKKNTNGLGETENTANVRRESSHTTTIFNESNKQESMLSQFLIADYKDDTKLSDLDRTTLKENKNLNLLNETKEEEVSYNSKIPKAGTSSEIPKEDSNLSKNKERTPKNTIQTELISKDDKNKELPLRILSNEDNIRGSLDVKINRDSKIKIEHSKAMNEDNNVHLPKEMLNKDFSNKDSKRMCLSCNRECLNNELKGPTDDKTTKEMGCKKIGCDCRTLPKHETNSNPKDTNV